MGNSIEAQTPSQTPDHVIHAAPVAEEHAELKTRNLEATGDELQASGPLVTGFVIPVNGHPIEADADSESSTAVGKPGHKSHTVLIDELIGEADMEAVTLGQIRRQLEQRLGEDYQRRKEEIKGLIETHFGASATPAGNKDLVDDVSDDSEKLRSPADIIDLTNCGIIPTFTSREAEARWPKS